MNKLSMTIILSILIILFPGCKKNEFSDSEETNVTIKILGNIFRYPDTYHPVSALLKIYIDDTFIKDLSYDGFTGINITFSTLLSMGTHKLDFLLISAGQTKVAPSIYIEYITSNLYSINPPAAAFDYYYDYIAIGDSFGTSFELKHF